MLTPPARAAGFTLLEAMITLGIFAILTALAVPSMSLWINNTKVRGAADALQNGVRLAQSESLRRSRRVVFSLTNGTAPQTAVANGSSWSIYTIPSLTGETPVFIGAGEITTLSSGITITGAAAICFSSMGRLTPVASGATGVGAPCNLPTAPPVSTYDFVIPPPRSDRPLRVLVALGGQVHMCDRGKTLSLADPDGCP